MGLPKRKPQFTIEQYLADERESVERHLYVDGEIFAMAGESEAHGDITVNVVVLVGSQLKGTPCRARTKDTKVLSGPPRPSGQSLRGMFSYPDIVVVCGDPEYLDEHTDVLLNPTAIFEVLSPSTEAFDRGGKFTRFQTWNPSLQDYVLISQDQPQIEHFSRQADGSWSYQRYTGLEASLRIASIKCELKLRDVFDRVVFPEL